MISAFKNICFGLLIIIPTCCGTDWTMFANDFQRTNRVNSSSIPENPIERCRFETSHRHENFYTSPAIVNGTIYIGSFISNLYLFGALPPYEPSINRPFWWWGDGYVYSIDAETCELNWEFNTGSWIEGSVAVEDGVVYVGNGDGFFFALDAETGEEIWEYNLPKENPLCDYAFSFIIFASYCDTRNMNSSPLIYGDVIHFGSRSGHMNMMNKTSGEMIRRVEVNGDMHAALALSNDQTRLYGATAMESNNVYAFDVITGDILWQSTIPGLIYSLSPAVDSGDRVFWPSFDGKLAAFDGFTGDKLWEIDIGFTSRSSVSLGHDGIVYVAGFGSELIAVDPENGQINWRAALDSFSEGVTVGENALVIGDYNGYLTKLETDGSILWQYCHTENRCDREISRSSLTAIQGAPVLHNDKIYFGSYDGNVYVIE